MFQNLEFYDKNGYNLNYTLNADGIYEGNIYIPSVSTGLYEVANVFIYERFDLKGTPIIGLIQNQTGTYSYKFRAYWENGGEKNDNIFLYQIGTNQELLKDTLLEQDTDQSNFYTAINAQGRKVVSDINHSCNKIKVALNSNTPGEYEKVLIIDVFDFDNDTNIIIAKITFYGEVVGEDKRLSDLLTNIGLNFSDSEGQLFSTTDPEEYNPDWKILNKKKKELMLENASIKNYEMSYFGLINAINFYGYSLGIKEWWQNVDETSPDYEKYRTVSVINSITGEIEKDYFSQDFNKPNKVYKKTNFLSLVYDINRIKEDEFDDENLPIVEEVSKFSLEQVLVKLYALKKKLSYKYIPTHVKIIDILAEGDYFAKMNTVSYSIQTRIDEINVGSNPKIKYKFLRSDRVEDLRNVLMEVDSTYELIDRNVTIQDVATSTPLSFESDNKFDMLQIIKKINTGEINNDLNNSNFTKFKETFISYFVKDLKVGLFDNNEYIPCGCMVDLWIDDFIDLPLTEYNYTTVGEFPSSYTIDTIKYGIKYELEWEIIKVVDINSPSSYNYKIAGSIKDYENIKLILPYTGQYDVSVRINDLNNNKSYTYTNKLITVNSLTPDFIGIYKEPYREVTVFSEKNKTIMQLNSSVDRPYGGNVMIKDINVCIDTFNQNNYANINEFDRLDNYYVDNLKNAEITDLAHLTIDNSEFSKIANWVTLDDLEYPVESFGLLIINDFTLRKIYSDLPTSFMIYELNNVNDTGTVIDAIDYEDIGNNIRIKNKIEDKTFNYGPVDMDDINEVNDFLTAIRSYFTNYEFNPLYTYDGSNNENGLDRITVTAKMVADSLDCDVEYWTSLVDGNKYNNNNLIGFAKGRSYMVNNDIVETNILYYNKTLPNFFQVVWCADNSTIPGKNNYKWTLVNNSNGKFWENDDQYFVHFFKETGEYSLRLEVRDTNGNICTETKTGLIKII